MAVMTAVSRTPEGKTALNMPPLRVDPALLGGTALARRPEGGVPLPTLAQQTAFAVQASMPHPSTTPMSHVGKQDAPTIVTAHRISGINDVENVAEGNAVFERAGDILSGDRIVYRVNVDEVEATGNVRLASPDTNITGPYMRMRMEESTGEFKSPTYTIRRERAPVPEPVITLTGLPAVTGSGKAIGTTGRMISQAPVMGSGHADKLEFRGQDNYHLENASYSTCTPTQRDWEIAVDTLDLDYNAELGKGRGAVVRFMDVPIFYTPWMNFSLNNAKKSGFLPPTIGTTSKSGLEVTAPYFWNIAPNMDATLTPRYMSRRGLQMNGEFRYLLDTAQNRALSVNPQVGQNALTDKGQIRLEMLPSDNLEDGHNRYAYAVTHNQTYLLPGHSLVANINVNGVSDSDYFSDLSTRIAQVSQGNLLRQGSVTLGGLWYGASVMMQGFQTLVDDIATPYRRLPQITAFANRFDLPLGMAINVNAEYVNYAHPRFMEAKRTVLYPQLSLPVATAAFWLTPKFGIHSTHYDLDNKVRLGADNPNPEIFPNWRSDYRQASSTQSRTIPVFSLDAGFAMERNANLFGHDLIQTLEPRAYYSYIPRRDQRDIPIFDSGIANFSYAQMFSENRYSGSDRIGDANQLTLAATSRLLDPETGAEMLRGLIGSRYYFTQQYEFASIGEKMRSGRSADLLAALAGQVFPNVYADVAWQYNPRDDQTERLSLTGRYRPGPGRIINAGYRFTRDLLGQIDVSAQWPLFGGWYGVGRYNYSTKEHRVIETIGGLEYNAGCWSGRFVVQRQATIANQPTSSLFFQLELNDFSKIGSNPMDMLRRSIPGYGVINQPTSDPVFAEN